MSDKTYTVIGVYADNQQRYADTFEASSPEAAEEQAEASTETELIIAGVIEGHARVVA